MIDLPGRPAPPPAPTRPPATTAAGTAEDPHRVMVVDDSAVIRGLLTRAIEGDPELRVVASVGDGQMAVNALGRQAVDVIVLDIEMPVMDGLSAIPKLLAVDPHVKIVMASTLTVRGAEVSMKAMQLGAADYIPKPTSTREISGADVFRRELVQKVKALAQSARRAGTRARPGLRPDRPLPPPLPVARRPAAPVTLRPMPVGLLPDIVAIGSSTGGPQALFEVLGHLRGGIRQPVLITQHMPATFTTILAEHISRQCGIPCAEAKDGEPLVGGRVYLAPGDWHMVLAQRGAGAVVAVNQDPPENFCRPAVDPMMRSIVKVFGRRVLAVILTGMGQDGMRGCQEVAGAGGLVLAQDEATSVVWGMPGAAANAGVCNQVLPLKEIGPTIRRLATGGAA